MTQTRATRSGAYLLAGSLVSSLVAWGCATPYPIVGLKPASPDVVWVSGRAAVLQEQTGVRVAAAFEHQDGGSLAIRIEVQNDSADRVEVDPSNVTFAACRSTAAASCPVAQRVADPEQAIAALDVETSRESAAATNDRVFWGTMMLIDVAASASGGRGQRRAAFESASAYEYAEASTTGPPDRWRRNDRSGPTWRCDGPPSSPGPDSRAWCTYPSTRTPPSCGCRCWSPAAPSHSASRST